MSTCYVTLYAADERWWFFCSVHSYEENETDKTIFSVFSGPIPKDFLFLLVPTPLLRPRDIFRAHKMFSDQLLKTELITESYWSLYFIYCPLRTSFANLKCNPCFSKTLNYVSFSNVSLSITSCSSNSQKIILVPSRRAQILLPLFIVRKTMLQCFRLPLTPFSCAL